MKKLFFIAAILASAMLTFSACEEGITDAGGDNTETPEDPNDPNNPEDPNDPNDPNNPEDPNDPNNPGEDVITDSELTPGEHKSRLEDIAIEFVNAFNPADVEELVYSAEALTEYAEYFDYGFGTESDDVVEDGGAPVEPLISGLQRFSAADLVEFATRVAEDFVIDVNDPDLNPYAGKCYTWNGADYAWVETDGKDKAIVFEWDEAVAKISWFGSTKVQYLYNDETNYIVYVPQDIDISITIGGKTYFTAKLVTNITDIKTWSPEVRITLNGGYEFAVNSEGNSKGLEAGASIKKNGKTLLNAATVVAINDATDIDNWMEEYYCEYCMENHMEISEYFLEQVKTGTAQINILALSIVGSGDFKGMYKEIEEIDGRYNAWNDMGEYFPEEDRKECNAICEYVNEKAEVVLIYNDTKERVANIVMATTSYYDEYNECNNYYIEPILVFPDGSKFAFEEYFTERAFGDLIEAVEALAEEFNSLLS